jgi:hypothetical protein
MPATARPIATCTFAAAVPAGRRSSHPAYLRATTDLDPEELRHEGGDRDRLGG